MEEKAIVFKTLCSEVLAAVKKHFAAAASFPIGGLSFEIYKIGEEELEEIQDPCSQKMIKCALHNNELLVICNDMYYIAISQSVGGASHFIKECFNDADVQFLDENGYPTTVKI